MLNFHLLIILPRYFVYRNTNLRQFLNFAIWPSTREYIVNLIFAINFEIDRTFKIGFKVYWSSAFLFYDSYRKGT